jgi:hypothetical protein
MQEISEPSYDIIQLLEASRQPIFMGHFTMTGFTMQQQGT